MDIHFTLRKQSRNHIITMQVFDSRFPGRKFIYSTGEVIEVSNWKKSEPNKSNRGKSLTGYPKDKADLLPVRELLKHLKDAAEAWAATRLISKKWTRESLRDHLEASRPDEQKEQQEKEQQQAENLQNEVDFFSIWKKIIETAKHPKTGKPVTDLTKKHKTQTLNLFSKYCAVKGFTPTLQNIDMNFYHALDGWMKDEFITRTGEIGLDSNTRGRHFKEIKAFMRECVERDHENVNRSFQKKGFKVIKQDVDNVYMTKKEIQALINLNYAEPKAELRAHYVVACFTGLRHSDWWQHDPANIIEHEGKQMFKIKVQKTGEDVYIPLHPVVKKYLTQYGKLRNITNQKFNERIKDFIRDAKAKKENEKLFNEVDKYSCHTSRRTFCTLAYLSRSVPTHTIMKISGHKSEASFLKYLKLGSLDHAIIAASSDFFTDESFTSLKVA